MLVYMPYLRIKVLTIRQLMTSLVLNNWALVAKETQFLVVRLMLIKQKKARKNKTQQQQQKINK